MRRIEKDREKKTDEFICKGNISISMNLEREQQGEKEHEKKEYGKREKTEGRKRENERNEGEKN